MNCRPCDLHAIGPAADLKVPADHVLSIAVPVIGVLHGLGGPVAKSAEPATDGAVAESDTDTSLLPPYVIDRLSTMPLSEEVMSPSRDKDNKFSISY